MSEGSKSNVWKTICLMVVLPLFITVVGGLIIEWLKPRNIWEGDKPTATLHSNDSPPPQQATSPTSGLQKLLLGKWKVEDTPTLYGELSVEFTENFQIIRETKGVFGDSTTNHPYKLNDKGGIDADPSLKLTLVTVSEDALVLSWEGTNVRYKRPWSKWMIGLAIGGFIVLCLVGGAIDAATKNK